MLHGYVWGERVRTIELWSIGWMNWDLHSDGYSNLIQDKAGNLVRDPGTCWIDGEDNEKQQIHMWNFESDDDRKLSKHQQYGCRYIK